MFRNIHQVFKSVDGGIAIISKESISETDYKFYIQLCRTNGFAGRKLESKWKSRNEWARQCKKNCEPVHINLKMRDVIILDRDEHGLKTLLFINTIGDLSTFICFNKWNCRIGSLGLGFAVKRIIYEHRNIFLITNGGNLFDFKYRHGSCNFLLIDCFGQMDNLKKILKSHSRYYGAFNSNDYIVLLNNSEVYAWTGDTMSNKPIKNNVKDIQYFDQNKRCKKYFILIDNEDTLWILKYKGKVVLLKPIFSEYRVLKSFHTKTCIFKFYGGFLYHHILQLENKKTYETKTLKVILHEINKEPTFDLVIITEQHCKFLCNFINSNNSYKFGNGLLIYKSNDPYLTIRTIVPKYKNLSFLVKIDPAIKNKQKHKLVHISLDYKIFGYLTLSKKKFQCVSLLHQCMVYLRNHWWFRKKLLAKLPLDLRKMVKE